MTDLRAHLFQPRRDNDGDIECAVCNEYPEAHVPGDPGEDWCGACLCGEHDQCLGTFDSMGTQPPRPCLCSHCCEGCGSTAERCRAGRERGAVKCCPDCDHWRGQLVPDGDR